MSEVEAQLASSVIEDVLQDGARPVVERADGDGPVAELVRALGGEAVPPPEVAEPALGPEPTAREVIHAAVARSVAQLFRHLPAARAGDDPEGVHQARVATRRLRSDLRTFKPLVDAAWAGGLKDELRWLGGELGAVRDADVLVERLVTTAERCPEIDPAAARDVISVLERQRSEARDTLRGHLDDERAQRLFEHLAAAAADPLTAPQADDPAVDRLPRLVRKRWRRLRRAVEALGPEPPREQLHEVRILAKRTRYAAEAVAPAFGKDARRFASAVERIQDVLGELNDAAVAEAWLAGIVDQVDGRSAFAAGRLAHVVATEGAEHRHGWERAYRTASRKRLRAWFR